MGQKDGEKWTAAVDLQATIPKSDRLPKLSRNSYPTRLARVLELAVASPRSDQIPTITLKQAETFSALHSRHTERPGRDQGLALDVQGAAPAARDVG